MTKREMEIENEKSQKQQMEKFTIEKKKLNERVFGKKKAEELEKKFEEEKKANRFDKLAKPKDKWKRLRILKQLR
jgi:hypothetical protein